MKDIAIYGAGGLGREIACIIRMINEQKPIWNLIGFFDDGEQKGKEVFHYGNVLGGINELNAYSKPLSVVIAIGNSTTAANLVGNINNSLIDFPNLIYNLHHMDEKTFSIGKGNIICSNCTFSCNVSIGDFNVFNGSVVLGHDVAIGSFNTFMPATRISGEVTIGKMNFFGVNSVVLQQIKIGSKVKLGAGSVLMRKAKDDNLYIGNPAKIFKY